MSDPDRRRLFRSVTADDATEEATEVECRKPGRTGVAKLEVGVAEICLCDCSINDSVEAEVLPTVFDAAAKRWAASCTFEGKVPALALLKPGG